VFCSLDSPVPDQPVSSAHEQLNFAEIGTLDPISFKQIDFDQVGRDHMGRKSAPDPF
jgi:hypothetical protein